MAKIKQEDLEHLSNDILRQTFVEENINRLPSPIKEYVLDGRDTFDMRNRLNRVERLVGNIVIKRFINNKL